jgi:hypothetical protein
METMLQALEFLNEKKLTQTYASANGNRTFERRSGHFFDMIRKLLGYFWETFGLLFCTLFGHLLDTCGTLVGHVSDIFNTFPYLFNMFRTHVGYFSNIIWTLVWHVSDTFGTCVDMFSMFSNTCWTCV